MTLTLTEWAKHYQAEILSNLEETAFIGGFLREQEPYQRDVIPIILDPKIVRVTPTRRKAPMDQTVTPKFTQVTVRVSEPIRIPNRASVEIKSPFFSNDCGKFAIKFNGVERKGDVCEYCISEGWIRVHARTAKGKFKLERGQFVTIILRGKVEISLKDSAHG